MSAVPGWSAAGARLCAGAEGRTWPGAPAPPGARPAREGSGAGAAASRPRRVRGCPRGSGSACCEERLRGSAWSREGSGVTLPLSNSLPGGCSRVGIAPFSQGTATGREDAASRCTSGGLGLTLEKKFSQKRWLDTEQAARGGGGVTVLEGVWGRTGRGSGCLGPADTDFSPGWAR